jgi:hypothetical protein
LQTQSEILSKYLKEHVFYVPPSAILAISPIDVPIPFQSSDHANVSTSLNKSTQKTPKKGGKAAKQEVDETQSLRAILTKIHKEEYFLSRLKQLYNENEQYLQVLQNILHSLLQLDEITKANGMHPISYL